MIDHMVQKMDQYDILIVDDKTDSLGLLSRILEERGYRVRAATNGRHALRSVEVRLPDLILLDVKMPGMDGYEVCRRLKANEQSRNVPVIFISAYGETVEKVRGLKVGAVDFITKPYEEQEVLARVQIHLRLRELTEHLEQKIAKRTEELHAANEQLRCELTEHKRMEKELESYREHLENQVKKRTAELEIAKNKAQQYLDIAGVILVAIDKDRRVVLINQKGCEVLQRTSAEIIGKDWFETFVPQNQRQEVIRGLEQLMAGELEPVEYFENSVLTQDGRERLVAWHNVLLRDDEGHITGTLSSGEDITERRHVEKQVVHLNQDLQNRAVALETANKELDAFAYTVSHDLRAPLRHIDGFLEMLQREAATALNEKSRHYMDAISESAQKMGLLIDDLLAFSRMRRHAFSFQQVQMGPLVHDVIRELEPDTAGRTIEWRIGDLPSVNGDERMLRIVMTNLISNALKFTRTRPQARIEIGLQNDRDSESVIFVRDNGVGFDMAYADKLFGVFHRLHRTEEFEGSGIGLASVRRIIARHGGRTWAQGEPDRGAVIYFTLPHTLQERRDGNTDL